LDGYETFHWRIFYELLSLSVVTFFPWDGCGYYTMGSLYIIRDGELNYGELVLLACMAGMLVSKVLNRMGLVGMAACVFNHMGTVM
jgi:hypothetical protein